MFDSGGPTTTSCDATVTDIENNDRKTGTARVVHLSTTKGRVVSVVFQSAVDGGPGKPVVNYLQIQRFWSSRIHPLKVWIEKTWLGRFPFLSDLFPSLDFWNGTNNRNNRRKLCRSLQLISAYLYALPAIETIPFDSKDLPVTQHTSEAQLWVSEMTTALLSSSKPYPLRCVLSDRELSTIWSFRLNIVNKTVLLTTTIENRTILLNPHWMYQARRLQIKLTG